MHNNAPQAAIDVLEKIASFGYAIQSTTPSTTATPSNQIAQALPDFPCDNLESIAKMIESNPTMSLLNAIHRLYPHRIFLPTGNRSHMKTLFDALKLNQRDEQNDRMRIAGIELLPSDGMRETSQQSATPNETTVCNGKYALNMCVSVLTRLSFV